MFLKAIFHDFQGLFPFLALVENTFISDSIGHYNYAAACSVLADYSKGHDECWTQCGLAVTAVSELELQVIKLELVELCCVFRAVSSTQLVQTLKVIKVNPFSDHIFCLSTVSFLGITDNNSVLLFIAIGGLKYDVAIEEDKAN